MFSISLQELSTKSQSAHHFADSTVSSLSWCAKVVYEAQSNPRFINWKFIGDKASDCSAWLVMIIHIKTGFVEPTGVAPDWGRQMKCKLTPRKIDAPRDETSPEIKRTVNGFMGSEWTNMGNTTLKSSELPLPLQFLIFWLRYRYLNMYTTYGLLYYYYILLTDQILKKSPS